jgi:hypothetical protein
VRDERASSYCFVWGIFNGPTIRATDIPYISRDEQVSAFNDGLKELRLQYAACVKAAGLAKKQSIAAIPDGDRLDPLYTNVQRTVFVGATVGILVSALPLGRALSAGFRFGEAAFEEVLLEEVARLYPTGGIAPGIVATLTAMFANFLFEQSDYLARNPGANFQDSVTRVIQANQAFDRASQTCSDNYGNSLRSLARELGLGTGLWAPQYPATGSNRLP